MRTGRTLVSSFVCGAIVLAAAASQERTEKVPQFRTGVSAVLVDVLVLDSEGNPVQDLTREDFEILEDGVEQEVTTFDVTDWRSYVAQQTGEPSSPAGVNTYPRRFVFVLNRQGARFEWLARAKRALASFIVESMADGDEGMVIDVGYSTKIVQQFRAAKEETIETVRKLSQMEIGYPMGDDLAAGQFYRDLESVAEALATLPGRKVVIVLSNELMTFPPPGSTKSNEGFALQKTVEALNQANASVYTIDLRGPESTLSIQGGLSPLATETGGKYFRNNATFEPPLRSIARENQRYYLLSYVSTNSEADGRYRKIDVRVAREGVEVIAREGYYARTSETEETPEESEVKEDATKTAPAAELPLAVELTTYLLPAGGGPVRVPVSVAFPEELLQGKGGDERRVSVTVTGAGGQEIAKFEGPVSRERFYLARSADLLPGSYQVEVVLRSEERELYRTSAGIEVPAGFGDRFGLSSVVPVLSPQGSSSAGDDLPILPTASVKRGENLHVLFQIFAGREEPAERARVSYRILTEDGGEVFAGEVDHDISLSSRPGGTPVIVSLPTGNLAFGSYRVEVRVEDPARSARATSELEIRVR
jgi:VWFA-related protein